MKNQRRKSIVTQTAVRVSVVFIASILMLTVIFSVFMWRYMKQNILDSKEEQIRTISEALEAQIDSLTGPIVSLAKYDPAIRLLGDYYEPYSAEWMQNIRDLDNFLMNVSLFNDYIIDINLIRNDSSVPYSMNDLIRKNYLFTEQDWFQKALEGEQIIKYAPPHGLEHLYPSSVKTSFSAIYPVYYAEKQMGYIFVECDLSRIAEFFSEQRDDGSGYILLGSSGEVIFDYMDQREAGESIDYIGIQELKMEKSISFQSNGRLYIMNRLETAGWMILSENDYRLIIRPIQQLLIFVAVLIFLVVGLLVIVTWLNGKSIEKPFNALIEQIVSYDGSSVGDMHKMENAPRELAVIGSRFEEMTDKVSTLINDVYVAELRKKEMELEALTNQINPHFIYNVFQLIQTKAVLADNLEIEDMIQKLSVMMRYTMERKRDKVQIREEVEYIENYLMFYKARFPQMFSYEVHYESELLQCPTLKFILQPVVENCFKHAFQQKIENGQIKIRISRQGEAVVFSVWDNGCGIKPEELERLRGRLEGSQEAVGIGIMNTNARIQLAYGSPYCLQIASEEGVYTEVTVRIRYERWEHV